jgi:hypothetical protein
MKNFAIIVDGEVVGNQTYSDEIIEKLNMERTIAIFSSDPKFVSTDLPIDIGSTWDGTSFTPPVE